MKMEYSQREVLRYSMRRMSRGRVKRHYLRWRQEQEPPLPERCDNPQCLFHTNPLVWNGKPLPLILDHINGNADDNNTNNLRLLCPNCDSQNTATRGGTNKGRIEKEEGGYSLVSRDGKRHHILPAESGEYGIKGSEGGFDT